MVLFKNEHSVAVIIKAMGPEQPWPQSQDSGALTSCFLYSLIQFNCEELSGTTKDDHDEDSVVMVWREDSNELYTQPP